MASKLQLTHTHRTFAPGFAAQMHDTLQELVEPPVRGNQPWRGAGEARVVGQPGRVPTGLLKRALGRLQQ